MEARRGSTPAGLPASIRPLQVAPPAQLTPTPSPLHNPTLRSSSPSPSPSPSPFAHRTAPTPTGPHIALPYLRAEANNSSSSLMDAVVGSAPKPPPSSFGSARRDISPGSSSQADSGESYVKVPLSQGVEGHRGSVGKSATSGGSSEWDVLSDASAKVNEGQGEEVVKELQEKVDKRRSQLPHLESELAALERQIKEAEARLARVQGVGSAAGGGTPP